MYKLINKIYASLPDVIQRTSDGAFIPFDPDNTDYQKYLKFIADGGVPLPAESAE